ncbi:MAG: hypothetical protein HOP12_04200 [Candidatus Eisenbacteria bacterium]|uniref:HpcH/HpaI aldolase/citrate lyase domain-containing protein n=1 Tax=Eiseniibacteriota bacterium TaxID=2212470 RepID=A0A849SN86_UNCEI|nr:hypothetical protein [Candidatus Eisenbacteria bacterium]
MSAPTREVPRVLLSGESLLGVSRASRDRTLEVAARYHEPESLAVTLSKAISSGADAILLSPTQQVRGALAELKQPLPVIALLPNVPDYVRDMSDVGLVGAAMKRVKRAGPATLVRLGLTGLTHAFGVVKSDFAAMVPVLLELEAASLGIPRLHGVVVAAPITDLALAGRHRNFFEHVSRFVRGRFGGLAGFETHNLGHLLKALREWGVRPDFVIGPVNPRGLLMKPSREEVLAELANSPVPVLAKELRAGGEVALLDGAHYARSHGAQGVVADFVDLEDLATELRALRG